MISIELEYLIYHTQMSANVQHLSETAISIPQKTGISSSLTNLVLDSDNFNSSLVIQTGGKSSFYIDKFGNTGINTTSPSSQLEIVSNNGSCLRLRYGTSLTAFADLFMTSSGNLSIQPFTSNSKITTTASLDISNHDGITCGLKLAGTLVTATAYQLNYTNVSSGTASQSKALVVDSDKNINGINIIGISAIELTGGRIRTSSTTLNISTQSSESSGNIYINGSTNQYGFNTRTFENGYQFTINGSMNQSGIYATGTNTLIYLKNISSSGSTGSTSIQFNSDSGSNLEIGQRNSGDSIVPNGFYIANSNYLLTLSMSGTLTLPYPTSTTHLNIGTATTGLSVDKPVVICNNTITTNTRQGLYIGYSLDNYNSAYFSHYYTDNESSHNRIGLGFYGTNDILTILPSGYIGICNNAPEIPLQVSGYTTLTIGSSDSSTYGITSSGYGVLNESTTINIGMKVDYGVHVGSVGVYVTSDRRVKADIKSIDTISALEFIVNTEPRTYRLKEDDSIQIGYIAQELRSSVFGPLISFGFTKKDFPAESKDDIDNVILVAQYERICCILHKGLQNALMRIKNLENQINNI